MYLPQSLTLDEFRKIPLEDIFKTILSENRGITIKLPDNAEVIIQPVQKLRPLPVFKGHMPLEWKEAIYHESE
ncbi:MAG: hypothetical protein GY795_07595 [Desulfobacterales bacterium]|nr:hypothetical protein [Desulfobacterales bacterium]